jgi:hypothetical protein
LTVFATLLYDKMMRRPETFDRMTALEVLRRERSGTFPVDPRIHRSDRPSGRIQDLVLKLVAIMRRARFENAHP